MPMLDPAMFDPASFASQPPGWLAQMLASQGGPSQGFPTPDAPPPDNGKIMPVPAMPPAVPPDAQASDADIPQTSLLGRLGGSVKDLLGGTQNWLGDHRATLAALGAGLMGSQNIGHGLQRAGQLIPAATQQDIAQQKQNQTVQWLVEQKHLSPQEAMAIVNNPEMMKQILPQLMGAKQLQHVTLKGTMGEDIPVTFDPVTGKYARADIAGGDISSGGVVNSIEDVPAAIRARVQAVLDGREAPPPGGSRSPQAQAILNYAGQVEPGFDFTKWTTRSQTAKDFGSGGKSGQALKSAEQGLSHVAELMKSVEKLPDSGSPFVNWVWNEGKKKVVGNPAYRDVMTNAHAVADEFSALWKGAGHSSDAEIRSWEANLDPNMTRAEWQGQVRKLMGLLGGSIDALETNRTRGMATSKELPPLLSDKSREIIDKATKWTGQSAPVAAASGAAAPAAPGAAPQAQRQPQEGDTATGPNGVRVILKGNRWVPVQ